MTIYLIGFMGSGKTTIGKMLHNQLQCNYTDTDACIEEEKGCTIPEIFAVEGEKVFREYEAEVLKKAVSGIISTGGGIVESSDNISYMKQNGVVVFLKTSLQSIGKRLIDDQTRPLWKQTPEAREKLFVRRSELYEKSADIIVTTDNKPAVEITAEVISLLGE